MCGRQNTHIFDSTLVNCSCRIDGREAGKLSLEADLDTRASYPDGRKIKIAI